MENILETRLKKLRQDNNYTQKILFEMLGVSALSYKRFEYGERRPSLDNLIKLAIFYDVSLDYLVGLSDDPKRY